MMMKLGNLAGGVATALLLGAASASLAVPAAAATVINVQDSGTAPFTALNLGTAGSAGLVSTANITSGPAIGFDGISSITFSGSGTGVYAGTTSSLAASPFPLGATPGSSLQEYFAVEPGGTVTINFSSPRTTLDMLWGTVDTASGYNVVTDGGTQITGAQILALAAGNPSSGSTNTAVEITGLPSFTSLTFTDSVSNQPAFEFDIGAAVPEPATWAVMLVGFFGLGTMMRRSRAKQGFVAA
jgi:hypothetical protein